MADYTAPGPDGQPVQHLRQRAAQPAGARGPAGGSALPTIPFPNCSSRRTFWAAIEGPNTDKVQGDRYMTTRCSGTATAVHHLDCSGGTNPEYRAEGYFWAVHVEPQAVNTAITVQIYDPAFIYTQITCDLAVPRRSALNRT